MLTRAGLQHSSEAIVANQIIETHMAELEIRLSEVVRTSLSDARLMRVAEPFDYPELVFARVKRETTKTSDEQTGSLLCSHWFLAASRTALLH